MTLISIKFHEKTYKQVTYYFKNYPKTDTLIIIFSGFSQMGKKPRYNYVNHIGKNIKAKKLFILDNHGYNKAGSYYLGENGNWYLPNDICELIDNIKNKYKIRTRITAGTSKGGTAALVYGIKCQATAIISGAPQYYIGKYLNTEKHLPILSALVDNINTASVANLDEYVRNVIISASKSVKPAIYLHYSPKEIMYEEHIVDMICDLKNNGYCLIEDNMYQYTEHSDVGKYFIPYVKQVCALYVK